METMDVVVVGGGLAGMAAAAGAAREGARVTILEAHQPGGRAGTATRRAFHLNQGPHALYRGGAGMRTLNELGVATPGAPPILDHAMASRDGTLHRFPIGAASLAVTKLLGPVGKAQFAKAMKTIERTDAAKLAGITIADWLAGHEWQPPLTQLMEAFVRLSTYTNAPEFVSADVAVSQLQGAPAGVLYLHGGWQTLVDGLAAVAIDHGATLHDHATVLAVEPHDGRVDVVTDTETHHARAVVLAAGSPKACASLLPVDPAWHVGPAIEASCLDLGLSQRPEHSFVHGIDTPFYLSMHSPPAALAPHGMSLVHVLKYLSVDGLHSSCTREELEVHARLAGIEESMIAEARHLHRMTVVSAAPTPATGGLAGRPGVEAAGIAGVFVAGDWVGPEGFLADASLGSGVKAGRLAAQTALEPAGVIR
jgi:phytoene dehydrogenase-like protein